MVLCNPSNHYPQNITRILVKNHDYQITAYLWNKYGQNHKKSKNVFFLFFFAEGIKNWKICFWQCYTVECILSITRIGILRFKKSSKFSSKISVNYTCSLKEDWEPLVILLLNWKCIRSNAKNTWCMLTLCKTASIIGKSLR